MNYQQWYELRARKTKSKEREWEAEECGDYGDGSIEKGKGSKGTRRGAGRGKGSGKGKGKSGGRFGGRGRWGKR